MINYDQIDQGNQWVDNLDHDNADADSFVKTRPIDDWDN